MYSYEDRLRAVQLYIRLGKRVGLTIRQLGYPTKNALKSWHREHVQRLDLHASCVRQPKYTEAQKAQAVKHYRENGRCLAVTISVYLSPSVERLRTSWPLSRTMVDQTIPRGHFWGHVDRDGLLRPLCILAHRWQCESLRGATSAFWNAKSRFAIGLSTVVLYALRGPMTHTAD
jgi:transposase-like protein